MGGGPNGPDGSGESLVVVVVAGVMNLLIALTKAVAGVLSGSAAMLSEAAHSLADTTTEILLFVAVTRGSRPADATHPFGHGKETFFWAFIASLFTFVAGAGFSITHGISSIIHGEQTGDFLLSYLVLAVSFVLESISLVNGLRQLRSRAARWRVRPVRYLMRTSDTSVKAVVLEDVAALVGLVLAALGLVLTELTGDGVWDGLASVAIGVLLLVVAVALARANMSFLVGRAAPSALEDAFRAELDALPEVDAVVSLVTMLVGPGAFLVAAKVDFADAASGASVEQACERAEERLTTRFPEIHYVFLDPTPAARQRPAQ
ncbi:MAG: cation diffusion facilitator family transporter [Pseudonocardia sp.]